MLTNVGLLRALPEMRNLYAAPDDYLNLCIGAADSAIKKWCKRDLELTSYLEYYSGSSYPDLVLRQRPVWVGGSTLSPLMDSLSLPQATIYLVSVRGLPSGCPAQGAFSGVGPFAPQPPMVAIQVGVSAWTTVSYTGTQPNPGNPGALPALTGCTGGSGVLSSASNRNRVSAPCVWFDQAGYGGQAANSFQEAQGGTGPSTLMALGTQFMADLTGGGTRSESGILRRIGGPGQGWIGFYPVNFYSGKLGASRVPVWPQGESNIKVAYSAGYALEELPFDLQHACTMLAACLVRNTDKGAFLSSESLGGYSYSILQGNLDMPEVGSLQRTLARYREPSVGLR